MNVRYTKGVMMVKFTRLLLVVTFLLGGLNVVTQFQFIVSSQEWTGFPRASLELKAGKTKPYYTLL